METGSLKVSRRDPKGSKAAARARRGGAIPAVLYGGGASVDHLAVPSLGFELALRKHRRVFDLEVDGKSVKAFLKHVQHDPLGDDVLHVDFLRIDERKRMKVNVPLEFKGHPKGLANSGEFVHPMNEVEVECLPTQIPESIRVVIDHLDVGMSITAKELTLPEGVTLVSGPDELVATVHLKGLEATPEATAAAEAGPAEPEMIAKRPVSEDEALDATASPEKTPKPDKADKEKGEKK